MSSVLIEDTDFTIDWIIDKFTNKKVPKQWTVTKLSGGFISRIFRLELEWEDDNGGPDSLILKIPSKTDVLTNTMSTLDSYDADGQKDLAEMTRQVQQHILTAGHANECRFYEHFKDLNLTIPCVYLSRENDSQQQGVIVMDDYSSIAQPFDLHQGLTKEQLLQVLEAIAAVHAASIKATNWEHLFKTSPFELIKNYGHHNINMAINTFKSIKPQYFADLEKQIEPFFNPEALYEAENSSHQRLGLPPVLVHGDLWGPNIIFDKQDQKLLALIDWQVAHAGNLGEDIARLLVTSCSAELRQASLQTFLEHYTSRFNKHLGYEQVTVEEVRRAYETMLPFSVLRHFRLVPVIMKSEWVREEHIDQLLLEVKAIVEDMAKLQTDDKSTQ